MRNILYSGYYGDTGYPFNGLAKQCVQAILPSDLKDPNSFLVLWGGADITPALYEHEESPQTYSGGKRDYAEWALVQRAIELGIPIIGVCRGAQMLCAAAGGYLFQHTTNHAGRSHLVTTHTGDVFNTNSIHHQMMCVPKRVDHEVLAWTTNMVSDCYIYDGVKEHAPPEKELECVYFPKIKGFAVQWHPEGMNKDSKATDFVLKEVYERTN